MPDLNWLEVRTARPRSVAPSLRMRRRHVAGLVVVLLVVGVACGSRTRPRSSAASSVSTTTVQPREIDTTALQSLTKKSLSFLTDLMAGGGED